jgi:membrane-associated protein
LNAFIIGALQQYGYPALWLIVFVAAAGAPVSGSLLLFAAGAFAALGDLNVFILFPVALSAAVMGDNLGYFIGRRVGIAIVIWLERKRIRWITPHNMARGRAYFRRRTAWAIFITRFLIVVLGGPINILAGIERYRYRYFLFWDVFGQTLSVVISLGLGYAFAASWEEVASIFGAFASLVLALLVAIILAVLLVRRIRRRRGASAIEIEVNDTPQPIVEVSNTHQPLVAVIETPQSLNGKAELDGKAGHDTKPLLIPEIKDLKEKQ